MSFESDTPHSHPGKRTCNDRSQSARDPEPTTPEIYVDATVIARRYSITPHYVRQLAASGAIPSIRIGSKCLRFLESEVIKKLEGGAA